MPQVKKECKCGKIFFVHIYRKDIAKYCSHKCLAIYRKKKESGYKNPKGSLAKMGEKNPMWNKYKSDVQVQTIHRRVEKEYPKPTKCELCGENKKLELSNKDHKYSLDKKDYQWICKKCHFHFDKHEKFLSLGRYKGKKVSEESRAKNSLSHIGRPPWNKGLRGLPHSWNFGKGKTKPICPKCGKFKYYKSLQCRNCRKKTGWMKKLEELK